MKGTKKKTERTEKSLKKKTKYVVLCNNTNASHVYTFFQSTQAVQTVKYVNLGLMLNTVYRLSLFTLDLLLETVKRLPSVCDLLEQICAINMNFVTP